MKTKIRNVKPEPIKTNLKTGDEVTVITGREKGKSGKVESIDKKKGRIKIPQINLVKKHRRATQENRSGEVVEIPAPINISNVMILCPKCSKGVRIKIERVDGKKIRKCHRCDHTFDKK